MAPRKRCRRRNHFRGNLTYWSTRRRETSGRTRPSRPRPWKRSFRPAFNRRREKRYPNNAFRIKQPWHGYCVVSIRLLIALERGGDRPERGCHTINSKDAYSLAYFINQNSARFRAAVLGFRRGFWVLVSDTQKIDDRVRQPAALEPVAEFESYLERAGRDENGFPREYVDLLGRWPAAAKQSRTKRANPGGAGEGEPPAAPPAE